MEIDTEYLYRISYKFTDWYRHNYLELCMKHLRLVPSPIQNIQDMAASFQNKIDTHKTADAMAAFTGVKTRPINIDEGDLRIAKRILLFERENIAKGVYERLNLTTDPETRQRIESKLHDIDLILKNDEFRDKTAAEIPSINTFLNSKTIADLVWFDNEWTDLDPKFGLLQSGASLYPLLDEIKQKCAFEQAPLSVAFFDIDNFKSINTEYTEQVVDREVLPKFMAHMVSFFKWHSFLFRQGGDEYIVIMPYFKQNIANEFLKSYQSDLAIQQFGKNSTKISVSIGVVHCKSSTSKCAHEIIQFANDLKQKAKQKKGSIEELNLYD